MPCKSLDFILLPVNILRQYASQVGMIFIINGGEYKFMFQMVFLIVFSVEGLLPAGLIILSTHNVVDEEVFFSILLFCFFNLILWPMKFVLRVEKFSLLFSLSLFCYYFSFTCFFFQKSFKAIFRY